MAATNWALKGPKDAWGADITRGTATINKILMAADRPLSIGEIRQRMEQSDGQPREAIPQHLRSLRLKGLVVKVNGRFVRTDTPPSSPRARVKAEAATGADVSDIEGTKTEAKYMRSKRSRKLRDEAMRRANGICAVCETDYSKLLNKRGVRALQAHHKKQIASLDEPIVNRASDLDIVCGTCHLLIHLDSKKALTAAELRQLLKEDGFFD